MTAAERKPKPGSSDFRSEHRDSFRRVFTTAILDDRLGSHEPAEDLVGEQKSALRERDPAGPGSRGAPLRARLCNPPSRSGPANGRRGVQLPRLRHLRTGEAPSIRRSLVSSSLSSPRSSAMDGGRPRAPRCIRAGSSRSRAAGPPHSSCAETPRPSVGVRRQYLTLCRASKPGARPVGNLVVIVSRRPADDARAPARRPPARRRTCTAPDRARRSSSIDRDFSVSRRYTETCATPDAASSSALRRKESAVCSGRPRMRSPETEIPAPLIARSAAPGAVGVVPPADRRELPVGEGLDAQRDPIHAGTDPTLDALPP